MPILSFRQYLLISILILSGIPTFILGVYQFKTTSTMIEKQTAQSDLQKVQSFARELQIILEARIQIIKALAAAATEPLQAITYLSKIESDVIEKIYVTQLQNQVDRVRTQSRYFDFMYIANIRGDSLAISPLFNSNGKSNLGKNYFTRDYFQTLIETEKISLSQVQLGKRSGLPNIQIVAPIFDLKQQLIGLAEGSINLQVIIEASQHLLRINRWSKDEQVRILVLDHKNKILVDTSEDQRLLSVFEPFVQIYQQAEQADSSKIRTNIEIMDRQQNWNMSYQTLSVEGDLNWSVIVLRNVINIHQKAFLTSIKTVIPVVILAVIILLSAIVFSQYFSKDIEALRLQLERIQTHKEILTVQDNQPKVQVSEWRDLFDATQKLGHDLHVQRVELKNSLVSLQKNNEQQTSLLLALEDIQEGIEITNAHGVILYANSKAYLNQSNSSHTQVGHLSTHWNPMVKDRLSQAKQDQLYQGVSWNGQIHKMIEDEKRIFHLTLSPQMKNNRLERVIIVQRDMTEPYRKQEALKTKERLASLGSLAAGIAHEVNNPLMYILANLSFVMEELESSILPEVVRNDMIELLEQAEIGAQQVKEISKSLLNIAHKDHNMSWVSVSESIQQCIRLIQMETKHQSSLHVDIQSKGLFYGNMSQLSQVLMNLVHNALHAMQHSKDKRAPALHINVIEKPNRQHSDDHWTVIEITDNGPGIEDTVLQRIFDPFFTTKERGVGTGLGLSVCQRIIHDAGGYISVESVLDQGTTFTIELPVKFETDDRQQIEEHTRKTKPPLDIPHKDKITVLVIDDLPAILNMLERQLRKNYIVLKADSATQALDILQTHKVDMILSDVMMPLVSGPELYQKVIAIWPNLSQYFIFMTGGILEDQYQKFFEDHDMICLEKPCSKKLLINTIEEVYLRHTSNT